MVFVPTAQSCGLLGPAGTRSFRAFRAISGLLGSPYKAVAPIHYRFEGRPSKPGVCTTTLQIVAVTGMACMGMAVLIGVYLRRPIRARPHLLRESLSSMKNTSFPTALRL